MTGLDFNGFRKSESFRSGNVVRNYTCTTQAFIYFNHFFGGGFLMQALRRTNYAQGS